MDEKKLLDAIRSIVQEENEPLKKAIENLQTKVTGIELTLENETNRNIKVIAEGHANLDRKLEFFFA